MANKIRNKGLFNSLGNIKRPDEWVKAASRLGLRQGGASATSHIAIRDPSNSNDKDIKSLVATIQNNLWKQPNQTIFKQFLEYGLKTGKYTEDEIWKALKML